MAHEWRFIQWPETKHPLGPETRKCVKCGAVQEREREYAWMRVVRSWWEPKVGRCPADKVKS